MAQELEEALKIPVQLVPIEQLPELLEKVPSGTVVTSRYFIGQAEAIAAPKSVRVIPIDIHNYAKEIELVRDAPKGTYLGIVSLSSGLLRATEVIIHSLRGDDILVLTAQLSDPYKINSIIRTARIIICDQASYPVIKNLVHTNREELIRQPQLVCCPNYIGAESINLLKRELGLS